MRKKTRIYEDDGEYFLVLQHWENHANEWAMKLHGIEKGYEDMPARKVRFSISFCEIAERDWSRSGKTGATTVVLKGKGYYLISEPETGRYGRRALGYFFWDGESSEMHEVTKKEVVDYFKSQNKKSDVDKKKDVEEASESTENKVIKIA